MHMCETPRTFRRLGKSANQAKESFSTLTISTNIHKLYLNVLASRDCCAN